MRSPIEIKLHTKSNILEIVFDDGVRFNLPHHYLRWKSPSADNRYNPAELNTSITIQAIDPVGNYAVKLHFSDGHNTGIYSWDNIYKLGNEYLAQTAK